MHGDLQLLLEGLLSVVELDQLVVSLSYGLAIVLSQPLVLFLEVVHVLGHLLLLLLEHLHRLLLALGEVLEEELRSLGRQFSNGFDVSVSMVMQFGALLIELLSQSNDFLLVLGVAGVLLAV